MCSEEGLSVDSVFFGRLWLNCHFATANDLVVTSLDKWGSFKNSAFPVFHWNAIFAQLILKMFFTIYLFHRCALQPWNPWKPWTAMAVRVRRALAGLVRRPARCLVRSASSTSVMSWAEIWKIYGNLSKHNSGLKKWSFNAVDNHLGYLGIGLCMSLLISPMVFL